MNIKNLFLDIISFLEINKIDYFITRNYEKYPDKFTGDIDIYVDLEKIYQNYKSYKKIIYAGNWRFFKIIKRPWVLVFQIISNDINDIDRSVMVIEHFNKFNWLYFEYANFEYVRKSKKHHNGISVLPKELGYALAFFHYVYWAGFIPKKYQHYFVNALISQKTRLLSKNAFPFGLNRLIDFEIQRIRRLKNKEWKIIRDIPEPVYFFQRNIIYRAKFFIIFRQFLKYPFSTISNLFFLFFIKLRDFQKPEGMVFYLSDKDEPEAIKLLNTFKKYHLFKNRSTKIISIDNRIFNNFLAIWTIYRTISSGGACIIFEKEKGNKIEFINKLFKNYMTRISKDKIIDLQDINSIVSILKFSE